jgi:flavodoxin
MKTLVVYYSRTGTTKKVAEAIADKLHCDIEEIQSKKDWKGLIGYMRAGKAGVKKETPEISPPTHDPAKYDLVLIGTPVWVGNMSAPVRTYLVQNKDKLKKAGFFMTMGGKPAKTFEDMESVTGRKAENLLGLTTKQVMNEDITGKIEDFVKGLTRI